MSFRRWLFPSGRRAANHYNRGTLACHSGDWISAEAHLREAVQAWQDFPEAWHNLGIALAAQSRFDDALEAYETALWQRRYFAEAWNNYGATLAKTGRVDDARKAFTESLQLKPSYQKARENLESLNEIVERHSDARDRNEPDPPGYRQVSLDWVAASTVDDPEATIIDDLPEPYTPILFDPEESAMIEAELGFMANDLYHTDNMAVSIERVLAAGGLEEVALSRIEAGDLRGAKSATIKAIWVADCSSSWRIFADILDAEGNPDLASAVREKADSVALEHGIRPEECRRVHALRRENAERSHRLTRESEERRR